MQVRFSNVDELTREVDRFIPTLDKNQLPRIGISSNHKDGLSCVAETYIQSVILAGGSPVMIPVITDLPALTQIIETLDGLILTGGGDLHPFFLNEEPIPELQDVDPFRDKYDLLLLKLVMNRQIPVFGICRGHQLIQAIAGGSLFQDIYSQHTGKLLKHSQSITREYPSHHVSILNRKSRLLTIFPDKTELPVNSFHHQAVKDLGPEFIETAVSPDGINEAAEHVEKYIFSVQWHPESMASYGNEEMLRLFRLHIQHALLFKQAKKIHQKIITLDSHTDTPMIFEGRFNIGVKEGGKVNLPFMEEGLIDAVFMVAYIEQGARDELSLLKATQYAENRLQEVIRQEKINPSRMEIAYKASDLHRIKNSGKKAIFLGIENGYAIGKDLHNLSHFKELGISYMTLCHNGSNDICDSARGEAEWNGLSPFGREVVTEMNRLGIMIDISHASEKTVFDVLNISSHPIIASHSSSRALCDHPRNLTDEQIKGIASKGGVIQVCLYKGFINTNEDEASLTDVISHINHIVKIAGIDHVGIGSDFDGDGELIGCRSTNELINITMRLLEEGYTETEIEKIWGGNLLRVMEIVQHPKE